MASADRREQQRRHLSRPGNVPTYVSPLPKRVIGWDANALLALISQRDYRRTRVEAFPSSEIAFSVERRIASSSRRPHNAFRIARSWSGHFRPTRRRAVTERFRLSSMLGLGGTHR